MQELYNYISLSRQHAQTDEQIKQALLEKGWSLEDINAALEDSNL
jgi:SOS response regulatory protein OraA/RecX